MLKLPPPSILRTKQRPKPSKDEIRKNLETYEKLINIPYEIEKDFEPIYIKLALLMHEGKIPVKQIGEMTIREVQEALKIEL